MSAVLGRLGRILVTVALVVAAIAVGWRLWDYYFAEPWTRDGILRADVVGISTDVSGLVSEVDVHDTQAVRKGDLLFRIDPDRFTLALNQAEADVAQKNATFQEADREARRLLSLDRDAVSTEQQQQATAVALETAAAYRDAIATRDVAKLNLTRSEVRATVNGVLTDLSLRPGDYVTAGEPIAALVDSDSFYVQGYFEETKLPRIHPGDRATVQLMGTSALLQGRVVGIAGGVFDRQRSSGRSLLPNINPTFTWVRLAQRIPVRVQLDAVPPTTQMIAGRTATVTILPSAPPR
ncbi:MAG TPA: HlyD family secretion protein [Rhodopila sp.]|jgi:multidrug resistance efflux pump|nr:HlyD family secretion protein [Rhodopila sp.]